MTRARHVHLHGADEPEEDYGDCPDCIAREDLIAKKEELFARLAQMVAEMSNHLLKLSERMEDVSKGT